MLSRSNTSVKALTVSAIRSYSLWAGMTESLNGLRPPRTSGRHSRHGCPARSPQYRTGRHCGSLRLNPLGSPIHQRWSPTRAWSVSVTSSSRSAIRSQRSIASSCRAHDDGRDLTHARNILPVADVGVHKVHARVVKGAGGSARSPFGRGVAGDQLRFGVMLGEGQSERRPDEAGASRGRLP
jgi:hypothetical protein